MKQFHFMAIFLSLFIVGRFQLGTYYLLDIYIDTKTTLSTLLEMHVCIHMRWSCGKRKQQQ